MCLVIMKKEMTDEDIGALHLYLQHIATQANILRSICQELAHNDSTAGSYGALAITEKIGFLSDRAIGFIDGDEGGDCIGGGEAWLGPRLPTDITIERRYEEKS